MTTTCIHPRYAGKTPVRWAIVAVLLSLLGQLSTSSISHAQRREQGPLIFDQIPPVPVRIQQQLAPWLEVRSASFQDFLPGGGILISTRFGNVSQLHRVAAPLAAREQLTFGTEPVAAARTSASGIIFSRDAGGNEQAQLWQTPRQGGAEQLLTDCRSRHGSAQISFDGKQIAFFSNARNGRDQDIYVRDIDGGTARLLVAGQGQTWQPLDWSRDGRQLLLRNFISVTESELHIVDVTRGQLRRLTLGKESQNNTSLAIGAAGFSADDQGIWLVSDLGGEFRHLHYFSLLDERLRTLTTDLTWDVEDLAIDRNGRYLAYVVNNDGFDELYIRDLGAAQDLLVRGLPKGLISNLRFDAQGKRLGLALESATQTRDVWTLTLQESTPQSPAFAEAQRWTRSEIGVLGSRLLSEPVIVRYPTWDRVRLKSREIPALVYTPTTPPRSGQSRYPVIVDIHGGPESQARPSFSTFTQYLVNELGYVVIRPNVRGSTGYGRQYTLLDNGKLREDAVRDIGSLLVWIAAQSNLNPEQVVIMGGSYGGYMTLATLAAYGDRLRGGINVVGISNFVTFLESTADYRRDLRRVEYGDERDPQIRAFLQRISPLNRAQMIRRPLLVVQGLNDPRVPASESEQLVARARSQGNEVWYLAARDEGHGFRKKANQEAYLQTVVAFLERLQTTR
ncbi:MAG: S9 family peptidase [Steroidobacteraceae bacterium]